MNIENAYTILGIDKELTRAELKKKYRQLMRLVHPDNDIHCEKSYAYTAAEINAAYAFLNTNLKNGLRDSGEAKRQDKAASWNAPLNENAYGKRKILDDVVDFDGETIGYIEIAYGKYLWILDEEFPLFMKSIFELSKELLEEIDIRNDRPQRADFAMFQAELAYHLACQFVDATKVLYDLNLDIENGEKEDTFYVSAMIDESYVNEKTGRLIYPKAIKNKRLYVCDSKGNDLGYLSFDEDFMPFVIIPLLKQKGVRVKMELSCAGKSLRGKRTAKRHRNVDLWLKIPIEQESSYPEDIAIKIDSILENYAKPQRA